MLYRYLIRHKYMFLNRKNTIQLVIAKDPYQILLYGKDILDISISIISKISALLDIAIPFF